jgi:hypothetical protein
MYPREIHQGIITFVKEPGLKGLNAAAQFLKTIAEHIGITPTQLR